MPGRLTILIVILMILSSGLAFGQNNNKLKVRIGLEAGGNFSRIVGEFPIVQTPPLAAGALKNGLMGGTGLEVLFTDKFSIKTGIYLTESGGKSESQGHFFYETTNGIVLEGPVRVRVSAYLVEQLTFYEFPLVLSYRIMDTGRATVNIQSGFALGLLKTAELTFLETGLAEPDANIPVTNIEDIVRKRNISVLLGLGMHYPLRGAIGLKMNLNYGIGLLNQNNSPETSESQKLHDLKLTAGLAFTL